jgi:hypothetical protein
VGGHVDGIDRVVRAGAFQSGLALPSHEFARFAERDFEPLVVERMNERVTASAKSVVQELVDLVGRILSKRRA